MKEVIPVSKKGTYRSVDVHKVTSTQLLAVIETPRVVFALDVAKHKVLVALADANGQVARIVHAALPTQLPALLALATELTGAGREVHLVLEPTGTYGDPIMARAHAAGLAVFIVSPKRTHDAAELFDGVPSKHDPKDAAILARLHAQGLSRRWQPTPLDRRELRALVAERELYADPLERHLGRLEAFLARHWPELEPLVEVRTRISLLRWLTHYIDPAVVRADPVAAAAALRSESRGRFAPDVVDAVVRSAQATQGVAMTEHEVLMARALVSEVVRLKTQCEAVEARLREHVTASPERASLVSMLAPTTTAVLLARVGDPADYDSAQALEKACGLNLKEHSSGTQRGGVHLTKRGPGLVRKYLFLLALRMIGGNPIVRAWYQRRRSYRPDHKLPAVLAVVRKLVKAIWHVARGAPFDATKLFEVARLGLGADAATMSSGGAATM